MKSPAAAPGNRGQRGRRRETELAPALELTRHHPPRVGVQHGVEHRVMRIAGLHHEPPALVPRSEDAGGPRQERHRLLAGAIPRGEQLLVEVDERDDADVRRRLMQQCLRPDEHLAFSEDRVHLLLHAADADAQVAQRRRATRHTQLRAFGATPLAHQDVRRLHDGGVAPLAARHLTAGLTRQQPRPSLAIEDAQSPPVRRGDGSCPPTSGE